MGNLAIFGVEQSTFEAASPDLVQTVTSQIEQLATGIDSTGHHGVSNRTVSDPNITDDQRRMRLTWNPAGILGGFGVQPYWDGAVASIDTIRTRTIAPRLTSRGLQLPHRLRDDLYIDGRSGSAMIRRVLQPMLGTGNTHSGIKPATTEELNAVTKVLDSYIAKDAERAALLNYASLPCYLEIGFGLDPSAIRGRRTFITKRGVGIDKATGRYLNQIGEYADAVHSQINTYANHVADQRPGQHILFSIGDAAGHLPFRAQAMREVFLSNVLNAEDLEDTSRKAILDEVYRVLEADGTLVLRVNWNQDIWTQGKMISLLAHNGFYAIRSVDQRDPEYGNLEAQYGKPLEVPAPDGYYLVAIPRKVPQDLTHFAA